MAEEATIEKVILASDQVDESDDLIRLSTGVVLRGKQANATALIKVMAAFPAPKPPMFKSPTMGREMENYNDPQYVARMQAWKVEQAESMLVAFIMMGTELVYKPDTMPGHLPETKKSGKGKDATTITLDFLDDYSLLNLPMNPQNEKWRYITWVQTVACNTQEDPKLIQEVVGRLSGVSKSDVQAAQEFPGGKEKSG